MADLMFSEFYEPLYLPMSAETRFWWLMVRHVS